MFRYLYSLLRQNDVLVFVLNFHILRKKKETININHKTETKIDNHMIDSLENHTVKKKFKNIPLCLCGMTSKYVSPKNLSFFARYEIQVNVLVV